LLSAFFAGLTAVLAKVGVQQIDSNLATAIRTVVILIFAWSVALVAKNQPFSQVSKRTWIFLILSGIATSLSWLCYFRALQLGEASQVAPVDKLSVVIAIALAAIFLHERMTWHHWVGGALIFTGAVVLAYAGVEFVSRAFQGQPPHKLISDQLNGSSGWRTPHRLDFVPIRTSRATPSNFSS
jgi:bacterial/archaeal transporter family protein